MIEPRKLISALVETIADYNKSYSYDYRRKEFDGVRDSFMLALAKALAADERVKELSTIGDLQKLKNAVTGRYMDVFSGDSSYAKLSQMYYSVDREREKLRDMRRTVDWATSWDHTKSILFRTLTTIMIAGVVLGTAFLAKLWDIPLPLLRPLGM